MNFDDHIPGARSDEVEAERDLKAAERGIEQAKQCIHNCESALGRVLMRGEQADLLADNFTDWPLDYIRAVVTYLGEKHD